MASRAKDGWTETIKTVFYALLIAGVFRTLFFQPFYIPSGSMKDTLLVGDFLFVNKMAYGYSRYSCPFSICPIEGRILGSAPERGDVVVFRHPASGQDLIKRLIGLPGDTIQMQAGRLYINGTAVPVEPAGYFDETYETTGPNRCATEPVEGVCRAERFRETLPEGTVHDILNIGDRGLDDTPAFVVPEGRYFFMGDNRDNSQDSRVPLNVGGVGFVPETHLIGRADRVVFSSAGWSLFFFWTWRPDRFFKAIE